MHSTRQSFTLTGCYTLSQAHACACAACACAEIKCWAGYKVSNSHKNFNLLHFHFINVARVLLATCLDAILQFSCVQLHRHVVCQRTEACGSRPNIENAIHKGSFCRSMPKVLLVVSLWTSATCATSPLTLCSRPLLLKVICVLLDIHCSQRTFVLESLPLLLPRLTDSSTTPCTCASEVETFAKPVQRCQVSHIHRLVMLS